jgi:hypothetical protein
MVSQSQHRALRLIACSHDGVTESLLLANRVTIRTMLALVKAGYASVTVEKLARTRIEVTKLQITVAGRKAISSDLG